MKNEEPESPWKRRSSSRGDDRGDRRSPRDGPRAGSRRSGGGERKVGRAPKFPSASKLETVPGGQWLEPVCGVHAVGSLFHCKPFIVERLYFERELAPMFGEICKFLAKEKKPYNQVDAAELARVAGTSDHGGVVAIARRRPPEYATVKAAEYWAKEGLPLVVVDGVSDPVLLGGIARTAAFYGVEKLLLAANRKQARPNALAYQAARGGLDMVDLRLVENVPSFLKGARKAYFTLGLDLEAPPLPDHLAICPEEDLDKPVAIVIGNEETGLLDATKQECTALVGIPGSGAIDRLGVEAETALLLQKYLVES